MLLTDLQLVQGDVHEKLEHALESVPLEWLFEGDAFVRHRALIDLLGRQDTDEEVIRERSQVPEDRLVRRILDRRNADGYWGTPQDICKWWPRKDTTFWVLGTLADFGLRKGDEGIAAAGEYVLSTQLPCGAFGWGPPPTPGDCFTGILTEALAKLGYGPDPRLAKAYDWLAQRQRLDGGFWCKSTGQPGMPRQYEPSCAFGTLCVLSASVQHPQLKQSPMARKAAEFLLGCWDNRGKIRYAGHDSQVGRGWEELKYPFTDYRILKYLDTLTELEPTAQDSRIALMIDLLVSKRDPDGRFYAESIHKVWSDFDFGQKAQPSRWITLLVYRIAMRFALPRRGSSGAAA